MKPKKILAVAIMIILLVSFPVMACKVPGSAQIQPRVYVALNPNGNPIAEDPKDTHVFQYIIEYRTFRTRDDTEEIVSDSGWILQPGIIEVQNQETATVYLNKGDPYSNPVKNGGIKYHDTLQYRISDYNLDSGYTLIEPTTPPGALILQKGGGVPHVFKYLRGPGDDDVTPTPTPTPTPTTEPVYPPGTCKGKPCIRIS